MDQQSLSPLAESFLTALEEKQPHHPGRKITVNPVVLKFATWFEKLRNAMEYHDEEVILRAAIERILRRRLLLGGNAKTTAEPLVRELIWAGYMPNNAVPENIVNQVESTIDLFLRLRLEVLKKHRLPEADMNEWTYQLLSSALVYIINPKREKEMMSSFMFQILDSQITIEGEQEETKNAQIFLAIRKAFAKDDIALLRYHLFHQYFGELTEENFNHIVTQFLIGFNEVKRQLRYPWKEKIFAYVKSKTPAFLILLDVAGVNLGKIKTLVQTPQEFEQAVFAACDIRYKNISSKVKTAIIRSVVFILCTKVIFAFAIEGTYESILYGHVIWGSILLNTGIPPILMLIVGLLIQTPDQNNSKRILAYITTILHDEHPNLGNPLVIKKHPDKSDPFLSLIFRVLWSLAFLVSFGGIVFLLTKLHFNIVSQIIFIFFLAIVSFLSYRISATAHVYTIGDAQGVFTPIVDFFFMPIIRVGRRLTEGITQINFLLFLFDLLIETPFKFLFTFFEQWFFFLHAKREELE